MRTIGGKAVFFPLSILLVFSTDLHASCAGVVGCDPCRETEVTPADAETACNAHTDCVAVGTSCGYWTSVNKASFAAFDKRESERRQRNGRFFSGAGPAVGCRSPGGKEPKRCHVVPETLLFNPERQDWFECTRGSECETVHFVCGDVGVAKKFRDEYRAWAKIREMAIDCAPGLSAGDAFTAACEGGLCVAKRR